MALYLRPQSVHECPMTGHVEPPRGPTRKSIAPFPGSGHRHCPRLGAIADDEAIVAVGRCAIRRSAVAPGVIAVLRDMGNPRACRLAARLEADNATPIAGNAP